MGSAGGARLSPERGGSPTPWMGICASFPRLGTPGSPSSFVTSRVQEAAGLTAEEVSLGWRVRRRQLQEPSLPN